MTLSKNQIIFFGFSFHVLAAFFSIGHHHCDELFQVFEFAGYKLGINTARELPWEFNERMRSGLQPFIIYSFTKFFNAIGITYPFFIAFVIRLFQSLLSFFSIVALLNLFEKEITSETKRGYLWFFSLLLWCITYFHARFSSENFSITLFLFGATIFLNRATEKNSSIMTLAAGLLFGLAFIIRFQMSFMIFGFLCWLLIVKKPPLMNYIFTGMGFIIALLSGLVIDKWLYGDWVLSWWNYVRVNLFENKASQFGESPFYFYFTETLLQMVPPFSVFIVAGILVFWWRFKKHVITWITLPFILLHFFVAHKELRFLFPVINFIPLTLALLIQNLDTENKRPGWLDYLSRKAFLVTAVAINTLLLLFFTFKPADDTTFTLKKIYDHVTRPQSILLYETNNPYNNAGELNYYRNPDIRTVNIDSVDQNISRSKSIFLFSNAYNSSDVLIRKNLVFVKVYASFPEWIGILNFNGWVERTTNFSIYKNIR